MSAMFSRIARRYDLMNGLMTLGMHHGWRRTAARQTIASPEGPALDLATGTGDLALELRALHPHRDIIAADFSMCADIFRKPPKYAKAVPGGAFSVTALS